MIISLYSQTGVDIHYTCPSAPIQLLSRDVRDAPFPKSGENLDIVRMVGGVGQLQDYLGYNTYHI